MEIAFPPWHIHEVCLSSVLDRTAKDTTQRSASLHVIDDETTDFDTVHQCLEVVLAQGRNYINTQRHSTF